MADDSRRILELTVKFIMALSAAGGLLAVGMGFMQIEFKELSSRTLGVVGAGLVVFSILLGVADYGVQSKEPDLKPAVRHVNPSRRSPMFDLSESAEAVITDLRSSGDPQGFARVAGNSRLTVNRAYITGPNSPPLEIPPPTLEFSRLSNIDLRARIGSIVLQLQTFQREIDVADREIGKEVESLFLERPNDMRGKMQAIFNRRVSNSETYDERFKAEFLPIVLQLSVHLRTS